MSAISAWPERLVTTAPSVTKKTDGDRVILSLAGPWIVGAGKALETGAASLMSEAGGAKSVILDLSAIQRLDTAGAWVIDRARAQIAEAGATVAYRSARPEHALLIKDAGYRPFETPKDVRPWHAVVLLSAIGETVYEFGVDFADIVDYLGEIVTMFGRLALRPWRWRWTSMVYHLERYSLRSAPIILLINFLVGAIVTQQGIFQLTRFGAASYAVNLVGVLGLRELGVLMTSIMIAGRTGSAITAEIGSMNMREEIDALKVMALDPLEVLVIPRLIALVIALPILTFLADIATLERRPHRQLDLCRVDARGVHRARPAGHLARDVSGRAHQGAVYGARDRPHRLDRGHGGARVGRVAWTLRHLFGGQVDFHGHRDGRTVRDVLRRGGLLSGDASPSGAIPREAVIRVRGLKVGFGDRLVMDGLDLDVYRGEVLGFVGPSGAGKSVLTRTILGLLHKQAGTIEVFGHDVDKLTPQDRLVIGERWGVLFQEGALFSSLTVRQNIQAPMREHLNLSQGLADQLAAQKLALVGLPQDAGDKLPNELSGGMTKRVSLARALALDPELVFLDEPTSGLDPISAGDFDDLIGTLQKTLGLTVFMVTHDLDSLFAICDRVAVLGHGKVIAVGPISELLLSDDPWLKSYFHGKRGVIRATAAEGRPAARAGDDRPQNARR